MTISFRLDSQLSFVISEGSGTLTIQDLIGHAESLRSDPVLSGHDELVDLSRVEKVEVTSEGLRQLASTVARLNPDRKAYRVAVVAPDDVVYGMARMYEVFRDELAGTLQTFRTVDEARGWLTSGRSRGKGAAPD